MHVRVGGQESEGLTEGDVRDGVQGEVLGLTAKVERAEGRVSSQVLSSDEVYEGGDVLVDSLLEVLDFFAGVLNAVRNS